jgi:glycosyltransferase involved in cell wall biosynthesis
MFAVRIKIFLTLAGHVLASPVVSIKKIARVLKNDEFSATAKKVYKIQRSKFARQKTYQEWIRRNALSPEELELQRGQSKKFKKRPLISIITPVFNPPVDVLEELLQAVLDQTYDNFELCLGNFGNNEDVKLLLAQYAAEDKRIKVWQFENKGIGENSNEIFSKVKGEYIALLDHDDLIELNALYENVQLLNKDDYDLIYSDSDKIDEHGKRSSPFFKPDWSPEMVLTANYVTHFDVIKKSIVDKIGGWDPETNGAQDWDLFLRISEKTDKIAHIPKILYHWRMLSTSTAASMDAKPYVIKGQQRAVNKYLESNHYPAKAQHNKTELYLEWDKMPSENTICVVRSWSPTGVANVLSKKKALRLTSLSFWVFHEYDMPKSIPNKHKDVTFIRVEKKGFLATFYQKLESGFIICGSLMIGLSFHKKLKIFDVCSAG